MQRIQLLHVQSRVLGSGGAAAGAAHSVVVSTSSASALPSCRVGFVGLGAMGEGMVACLLRDGFQVAVLGNVNRGPVDRLVAAGAVEALGPLELAQRVDVICLCLPNSDVVEDVIERMKPALVPGKTILDTGTSSLASTARLGQTLGQLGVGFAEAPLTGGKAQADEGVLGALVGTSGNTFSIVKPVLDSFCSSVQLFGPVGSGGRAKLINNAMVIGIAALVLEAFRKARRCQTNWAQLYDVVTRGSADSGVLRRIVGTALGHTPPIDGSDNKYRGFANAYKDMQYIVEMDEHEGFGDSALNTVVLQIFHDAVEEGLGDLLISELLELDTTQPLPHTRTKL